MAEEFDGINPATQWPDDRATTELIFNQENPETWPFWFKRHKTLEALKIKFERYKSTGVLYDIKSVSYNLLVSQGFISTDVKEKRKVSQMVLDSKKGRNKDVHEFLKAQPEKFFIIERTEAQECKLIALKLFFDELIRLNKQVVLK